VARHSNDPKRVIHDTSNPKCPSEALSDIAVLNIHAYMAIIEDEKPKVAKLRGITNWPEWKTNMRYILISKDLDQQVFEEPP